MLQCRQHRDHHPLLLRFVPEHLRVAEVAELVGVRCRRQRDDRVAGVLRPGAAAVDAVGERLRLRARLHVLAVGQRQGLRVQAGEHRHHRRLAGPPEAAGVLQVHHRAAGEEHLGHVARSILLGLQRDRQLVPAQQVTADGVAPGHVAPLVAVRVVLVEEVVLAVVVDEPVRVVHPVLGRRELELRAVGLAEVGRRVGIVRIARCGCRRGLGRCRGGGRGQAQRLSLRGGGRIGASRVARAAAAGGDERRCADGQQRDLEGWEVQLLHGCLLRFYFLPQHRSRPVLVSLLSTPAIGLLAIRVTPVSV